MNIFVGIMGMAKITFEILFYRKIAIKLSGLDWTTIGPCHRWMESYFQVILQQPKLVLQEKNEQIETKFGMNSVCSNINTDDSHIIQLHTTSMDMFVSIFHFFNFPYFFTI